MQVTAEVREQVIQAMLDSDPTLRGPGYLGTGHEFRCPRGHVYFIGECGGPVQTSTCPECGLTIGGTGECAWPTTRGVPILTM